MGDSSCIDQFMICNNLISFITKYDVYLNIDNVSDHLPIQLIMKLDMPQLASTVAKSGKLICWSNTNYMEKQCYKSNLNILLDKNKVPNLVECNNMLCYDNHSSKIEQYHVRACNEATHASIKTCRRKSTGDWVEHGTLIHAYKIIITMERQC